MSLHKITDIGATDMLAAFEKVIACFPEGTVFENTAKHWNNTDMLG